MMRSSSDLPALWRAYVSPSQLHASSSQKTASAIDESAGAVPWRPSEVNAKSSR